MPVYKDSTKNTWYVSIRYKDWKGQSQRLFKRGFKTKKAAKKFETVFLMKIDGNLDMNFEDFVEIYFRDIEQRIKYNTLIMKQAVAEHNILPYFKQIKIADITPTMIMQWQNEMMQTKNRRHQRYSETTLKSIHSQLSAIFNHAVRYYHLESNPCKVVGRMESNETTTINFWTTNEYKKFSEVMMDKPLYYVLFEVLYWCGLRMGECLALTYEDINFRQKKLRINKSYQRIKGEDVITSPKTKKSVREVEIPEFLVDELKDYTSSIYKLKKTDRIFPVYKNNIHRELERGCRIANVKKIRVHDLRHSHISLLIEKGFTALAIADRVGHETITITYRYAHLFPNKGREIANYLNDEKEVDDESKKLGQPVSIPQCYSWISNVTTRKQNVK